MTLEKLLILGFAIAAVTALTLTGTGMMEDHEPRYGTYADRVEDLVEMTAP
jgi:hypothetical protein